MQFKPILQEKLKGWKEVVEKFPTSSSTNFIRNPEGLPLSRARGFTPESTAQLFEIYEPAMDTIQHNPARLYNCDETGITIVQHKHTKI